MADLGHLLERVPDGQGNPAETERRHQASVSATRHEVDARLLMGMATGGDLGAARRHLNVLRHDPAVDPWKLAEALVAARALRAEAGTPEGG
jgi:hypothetical protein